MATRPRKSLSNASRRETSKQARPAKRLSACPRLNQMTGSHRGNKGVKCAVRAFIYINADFKLILADYDEENGCDCILSFETMMVYICMRFVVRGRN
jgi:hypothetical protein